jgi:hypothetical protein
MINKKQKNIYKKSISCLISIIIQFVYLKNYLDYFLLNLYKELKLIIL